MTTRFSAKSAGLRSGYDNPNTVDNFTIPSCGIEDVDKALFHLFDKEIPFQVMSVNELQKVNVIFAAGEKWAIIKNKKSIRDRQGRLILPLITIGRTSIVQDPTEDIAGRGINQQTGEMVLCRRLANSDRNYQNLINRLYIKNQSNVAFNNSNINQLNTERVIGDLLSDIDVTSGGVLKSNKQRNIWETITAPTPQFYTAKYEVIVWTQYTTHMNEILDLFITAQLPQGNAYKISNPTNPGYWFIATVDGNNYEPENNFDDMFEQDRIIKYKFNINVPAYLFASDVPGAPIPLKRYLSATEIDFSLDIDTTTQTSDEKDPFLGMDDPTLPSEFNNNERNRTPDNRKMNYPKLAMRDEHSNNDPALQTYQRGIVPHRYMSTKHKDENGIVSYNHVKLSSVNNVTGETTFKMSDTTFSSWFGVSGSI
jgi:hypothetical protein